MRESSEQKAKAMLHGKPSEEQVVAAWVLVFERQPDCQDYEEGLYSHLCAALDITEANHDYD